MHQQHSMCSLGTWFLGPVNFCASKLLALSPANDRVASENIVLTYMFFFGNEEDIFKKLTNEER